MHRHFINLFLLAGISFSNAAGINWVPMNEPGCGGFITSISASPFNSQHLIVGGDMLGVGVSRDGGETWAPAFGFKSWEINDITWHPTDPDTVWIGTLSGPYVSHDGGKNWIEKRNGMFEVSGGTYSAPVEKVLFDLKDEMHLLAFGGSSRRWDGPGGRAYGAVWESLDKGDTWTRLCTITETGSTTDSSVITGVNIVAVAFDSQQSDTLYALSDTGGVHVSLDCGKTWEVRNNGLPIALQMGRIAVHPTQAGTVYIGLKWAKDETGKAQPGGIYKTDDFSKNWRACNNGLVQQIFDASNQNLISNYGAIAISQMNPKILYTCDGSWAQSIIYKSEDGGASWRPVCTRSNEGRSDDDPVKQAAVVKTCLFSGLSMGIINIDPTNENNVYATNMEYIVRTRDGGKTWDDATAYQTDQLQPDNWCGRGYSGWCSTDFAFNPKIKGDSTLVGMDAGKFWRSTDDLQTWRYHGQQPEPWGGGSEVCYAGSYIYVTAGQFGANLGVLRHDDTDGSTVNLVGAKYGLPEIHTGGQPTGIYANPDKPEQVWVVIGGKLFASENAGDTWEQVEMGDSLQWLVGDPTRPGRFYASGKYGIYVTEDGMHFRNIGGPRPAGRGRLTVDTLGRVWACQWREGQAGLWRFADGQWERILDDAYCFDVAVNPQNSSRVAVVANDDPYHDYSFASGIWVSDDDGRSWSQANDGLGILCGQTIEFDPHNPERLVCGTHGGGFYIGNWPNEWLSEGTRMYQNTEEDTAAVAVTYTQGPVAKDKPDVPGWGFWSGDPDWWIRTHEAYLNIAKQDGMDIVFFGDSITEFWNTVGQPVWEKEFAPLRAVNFGISADTTRQVLWRIDHGEVDGISPSLVVLKIGTNNLYEDHNSGSDEEIAAGIITILNRLQRKLPSTKILLLGILPREGDYFNLVSGEVDDDHYNRRIANINTIISKRADGEKIKYLDLTDKFLEAPGKVKAELYSDDKVHLAPKGYEVMAAVIKPVILQMLEPTD